MGTFWMKGVQHMVTFMKEERKMRNISQPGPVFETGSSKI
jgi:hypothetical protein